MNRKSTAKKVAATYVQNRTSARPIPIDLTPIRKAMKEILAFTKIQFKNVGPSQSIASAKMRQEGIERIPAAIVPIETLSGKQLRLKILVGWSPNRLAAVDRTGTIAVFLNSGMRFKDAFKKFERELESSLVHEITHMSEYKPPIDEKQDTSSPVTYYNDPYEIRAYMRNIFEEALPHYESLVRTKQRGTSSDVLRALEQSEQWLKMKPYLTEKNRKTLLKGVTTALEEATLKKEKTASNLITVFVESITLPSKRMMGYAVDDDPQWFRYERDVESHVIGTIKDHVEGHSKVKSVGIWNHQNFRSFNLTVEVRDSDWERATYLVEDLVEKAIVELAREFDQRFVADMKIGEISFS